MSRTHVTAHKMVPLALALGVGLVLSGCSADQVSGTPSSAVSQADTAAPTAPDDAAAAESPSEDTSVEDVPTDDVAPEDADSEESEDDELPSWIADAFPIYPGSTVAAVDKVADTSMASFFTPSDDGQAVYQWFIEQYGQNGWTIDSTNDDSMDLYASHADGLSAYVNVTQADGLNASWVMTAERE